MNYLAHLYLSEDNDWVRLGNLMGDFVKGQLKGQYPPLIEKGIQQLSPPRKICFRRRVRYIKRIAYRKRIVRYVTAFKFVPAYKTVLVCFWR